MRDLLLTDLRSLIADLGHNGGAIGPSIYDTAQVLRMAPPEAGIWPAIDWLLSQQQPDGGWGDPMTPLARDVPTLAVILLLKDHNLRRAVRDAVDQAVIFLRRQTIHWSRPLLNDLPTGIELLLPHLLQEAIKNNIQLNTASYNQLIALGQRRRKLIEKLRPPIGTPPFHSWEAWGNAPDPGLLDTIGSVGHSPSATAAWISMARAAGLPESVWATAQNYLEQASIATGFNIPGLAPAVWPITRFEQSFGLYALLVSGLLKYPALQPEIEAQIDELATALRADGISMSDFFASDGDDTAAAVAVLHAADRPVDGSILNLYANEDHFCAWRGELQPSTSLTARAIHALDMIEASTGAYRSYLLAHQMTDGRWPADKWHGSWLYPTCHAVIALSRHSHQRALEQAVEGLLAYQQPDGGWGADGCSNTADTAFAIISLRQLLSSPMWNTTLAESMQRGFSYMCAEYRPFSHKHRGAWLGKELYRPDRIDRAFELGAMLSVHLHNT